MSFPDKEKRQKCWDSRDRYWECLDKSGDQMEKCMEVRAVYETTCPSQWVSKIFLIYGVQACLSLSSKIGSQNSRR